MARRVLHIRNGQTKTLCNRDITSRYRFIDIDRVDGYNGENGFNVCPRCLARAHRLGMVNTPPPAATSSEDDHLDSWLSRLGVNP